MVENLQVKTDLREARWLAAAPLQRVLTALETAGEARIAGGAVRDGLLGRPVSDIDIATTLEPEKVIEVLNRAGIKTVATGIEHGTVTAVAGSSDADVFQVTTLRVDVETDGRHAMVAFTDDWTQDARRRDFTMNAIYCDRDGVLFDPLNGYEDLARLRVRFVGDARERITEDYLRILRFFRFNAVFGGSAFDPVGLATCAELRSGLDGLSHERIRQELLKLLVAPGAVAALETMAAHDILEHLHLGDVNIERFARLCVIEARSGRVPDAVLRLAALALTCPGMTQRLRDGLRLSNEQTGRLQDMVADRAAFSPDTGAASAKVSLYRLGAGAFIDAVLFDWASAGDDPDDEAWADLLDLPQRWTPPRFPLRGADLTARGIGPGEKMGAILRRAEALWIECGFPEDETTLDSCLQTAIADCNKRS